MTFAMKLTGMDSLIRVLDQMPIVMRSKVIVPAVTKGAKTIERTIAPLIPYNIRNRHRKGRHAHYRTSLTSVVRDYPLASSVVGVVGAESGKAPHSILVEEGTRPRFTNSKPIYKRMATGVKTIIKHGKLKTKVVRQKKSIGSKIKDKRRVQLYRGVMPASHPVNRGVEASRSEVQAQLQDSISRGITRELTAAKLARGVT